METHSGDGDTLGGDRASGAPWDRGQQDPSLH